MLDAFTFIFHETAHGLFQVHAYPFSGTTSTFIVECAEATWRRAGLDEADEAASLAFCQDLLADDLGGAPLLSNNSKWISFPTLKTKHWHAEPQSAIQNRKPSSCWATPPTPPTSPSAPAPSWRWRTPSRWRPRWNSTPTWRPR